MNYKVATSVYAWTDSSIVLSWLKGHPTRWKTFVANRVSLIHELLGEQIWRHVPSSDNPADCASRGISPQELKTNSLWWDGPQWLCESKQSWPERITCPNTELEAKRVVNVYTTTNVEDNWNIFEKYSSLTKLIRVLAFVFRFIQNTRRKPDSRETDNLTAIEHENSLKWLIKKTQNDNFAEEIHRLNKNRTIPKNSKLLKLNPFIHVDGIIRVGGRLRNADIPFEEKHPIILPQRCTLTDLLIKRTHASTLHGGSQLMLTTLRQKYWIINGKRSIRSCIHNCLTCHRQKTATRTQLMGDLPAARVRVSRPFSNAGVDYCGPFTIRMSKGRGSKTFKGYVAIFICLAVKAIHIELVSDLTSQAFLAAFRRFVSRRGLPNNIYSDCGSNFIGANNILQKQHQLSIQKETASSLAAEGIVWNFIPPSSPHFGGLWEAGVKSTKFHLKRIIGQTTLTFEFTTVLAQIEAGLNSRPISELSNDINDLNALTPGHFLVGSHLITPPEPESRQINVNCLQRWHFVQQLYQSFWKRWTAEYLTRLQQRPKWTKPTPNITKGELVLIKDDNLPPCRWALGRVLELHPGADSFARVVTVKTKDNIFKRPITKLSPLPAKIIHSNEIQN